MDSKERDQTEGPGSLMLPTVMMHLVGVSGVVSLRLDSIFKTKKDSVVFSMSPFKCKQTCISSCLCLLLNHVCRRHYKGFDSREIMSFFGSLFIHLFLWFSFIYLYFYQQPMLLYRKNKNDINCLNKGPGIELPQSSWSDEQHFVASVITYYY